MKDMSRTKIIIYNLVITLFLFLLTDFSITHFRELTLADWVLARVEHPYFGHTIKARYEGRARWGHLEPQLCTDRNGFKTSCDKTDRSSLSFDVVFIGDSFTEAVGMNYEDSFIGMYDLAHPTLEIANLGIAGYRFSNYVNKIAYYLERGLKTKHVVVFIDNSDVFDEFAANNKPSLKTSSHSDKNWRNNFVRYWKNLKIFVRQNFHYTSRIFLYFKYSIWSSHDRGTYYNTATEWSYHPDISESRVATITSVGLAKMEQLWTLLNQHGIALSVGVYPYREQLLYSDENNRQVQIWEQFCKQRCFSFINAFPAFFDLKKQSGVDEVIQRYFILGDGHYTEKGNEVVFKVLNKQFKIGS